MTSKKKYTEKQNHSHERAAKSSGSSTDDYH